MKRIIPFSIYLLLVMPAALFANLHYKTPIKNTDTSSNITGNSKSLILRGSLSKFNAAYGKNYFELNWNTIAGDFDHFEIERVEVFIDQHGQGVAQAIFQAHRDGIIALLQCAGEGKFAADGAGFVGG